MNLNKLTLLIAAVAVCCYAAFVWYDCAHDESCRVVYCGARHTPCGLAHKGAAPQP